MTMWETRWKLFSLSAALIATAAAQLHTIDHVIVIQPDNVPSSHEGNNTNLGNNNTLADPSRPDNSSYNSENTGRLIDNRTVGSSSDEHDGISIVLPNLSDAKPASSYETTEIGESTPNPSLSEEESAGNFPVSENRSPQARTSEETNRSPQARTSEETNEPPQARTSEETDRPPQARTSEETDGPPHARTSEETDGSPQTPSSKETEEKPISTEPDVGNPGGTEPNSAEPPGSGEVGSVEPGSQENPSNPPSTGVSAEGNETSDQNSSAGGVVTDDYKVQTTHGPVKGYPWPGNTEITAFYDIPYGKLTEPFGNPDTARSWLDIHQASEHSSLCPQLEDDELIGDTDCLTLSIFTPKDADNASVLFHIYDSYASAKSADPKIYGPDYLVPKGIILVLPNYRIGPMGFLCLHNETALGNAGLKDLSMALEWIKDNIQLFGGNPSNIAVSGDGAASAYAGYLAICVRSKNYIDKAITESGSALSHWALDRDPTATAYQLAERIRAEHSDSVINNTFAEATLETILRAAKGMKFKPCIERDKEPFIVETPWKILQNKGIETAFMIGSANYAGTHEAAHATPDFVEQINEHFDLLLPDDLVFENDDERDDFVIKLRSQYFGADNITTNHVEELSLWYTDASYLSPSIRLARPLVSAGATVYLYEFSFVGSLNRELEALNKPVQGAVRGDSIGYLFCKAGTSVADDSPERHMIDLMVNLWTSFITNGKPEAPNVEWNELKQAEDEDEEWLVINSEPKLKTGIHVDRLRLWTSLYDQHFIENSSPAPRPSRWLALPAALICLMANKLNYSK